MATHGLFGFAAEHQRKLAAWQRATPIPGFDPNVWRRDAYGRAIKIDEYGKLSKYGWEIDHITPLASGGRDTLDNLRAMYWSNNRSRGGRLGAG